MSRTSATKVGELEDVDCFIYIVRILGVEVETKEEYSDCVCDSWCLV